MNPLCSDDNWLFLLIEIYITFMTRQIVHTQCIAGPALANQGSVGGRWLFAEIFGKFPGH